MKPLRKYVFIFFISIVLTHMAKSEQIIDKTLILYHIDDLAKTEIDLAKIPNGLLLIFISQKCLCSPDSLYALNDMYQKYSQNGLQVIGLNVDNDIEHAIRLKFIKSLGYKFPVYMDKDYKLVDYFGIKSSPQAILLDNKKNVVYKGAIIKETIEHSNFVSTNYLKIALSQFVKNKPIDPRYVKFIGCAIKPGVFENDKNIEN